MILNDEQKKLITLLHPELSFLDLPDELHEHFLEVGGLEAKEFYEHLKFNAICSCGLKFKRVRRKVIECPICRNTKFKPIKVKEIKVKYENQDFSNLNFDKKSFGKKYKFYFKNNEIKVFNSEQMYQINWFTNDVKLSNDKKEVYFGKIIIEDDRVVFYNKGNQKMNILLFVHLLPKLSVQQFIENYNKLVPLKPLYYIPNMTRQNVMDMLMDERIRILSELFKDFIYVNLTDRNINANFKFPENMIRQNSLKFYNIENLRKGLESGEIKETSITKKTLNVYELLELPKSIVKWMVKYYDKNGKDIASWQKKQFIFSVISIYQRENKNTGLTLNLLEMFYKDKQNSIYRVYEVLIPKFYYLVENGHKSNQLMNYINNEFEKQVFDLDKGLTYYEDYVRMSLTMEVLYTKYPKNLDKVHDVRAKDYQVVASKEESKLFKKIYKDNPLKESIVDDYTFVAPEHSKDLVAEGQKLNHCVASYVKKVVNKQCLIYMMRKTNNIDNSFITIEIANRNVVQVRGKHNALPTPEVKEVVKKWANLNGFKYVR